MITILQRHRATVGDRQASRPPETFEPSVRICALPRGESFEAFSGSSPWGWVFRPSGCLVGGSESVGLAGVAGPAHDCEGAAWVSASSDWGDMVRG